LIQFKLSKRNYSP